ncbi:NAD-dependent histone deacetylase sir2 [Tulasnella sp. JGI-2019a]|nr:NAD-dependent histone deacetylase sir2 [Tulasnella sp. JGI-2019a]
MKALENRKKPAKKRKRSKKRNPWDGGDDSDTGVAEMRPSCVMKPGITFFGEAVTNRFDKLLEEDRLTADLLLIIGTSLKVAPVSEILTHLPHSVPQILINKTLVKHVNPDVVLLGDADEIVRYLCQRLDWELPRIEGDSKQPLEGAFVNEPKRGETSHVWLFDGAEPGVTTRNASRSLVSPVTLGASDSAPSGLRQTSRSSSMGDFESTNVEENPSKRSRRL